MISIGGHFNPDEYVHIMDVLKKVHQMGGNGVQLFLGDKTHTTTTQKYTFYNDERGDEKKEISKYLKEHHMKLFIHSIYTINFCFDPFYKRFQWGLDNLIYDMNVCREIGGEGCVLHFGHYQTKTVQITKDECFQHYIDSIIYVLDHTSKVYLYLETSVGNKNSIGGTCGDILHILTHLPPFYQKRVRVCIDTAHLFVSGYDIRQRDVWNQYIRTFPSKWIGLIHLNDTLQELNSRINRHCPIGKGFLFSSPVVLSEIVQWAQKEKVPLILETDSSQYAQEIKRVKEVKSVDPPSQKNIKPDVLRIFKEIRDYYTQLSKEEREAATTYKIASYQKVIEELEQSSSPLYGEKEVSHWTPKMRQKVAEIQKTGTMSQYEEIHMDKKYMSRKAFMKIWGVGVEKAKEWVNQGIYTLENIKEKGVPLTAQQEIGIRYYNDLQVPIPYATVELYKKYIKRKIKKFPGYAIHDAGSHRMGKDYSMDMDFILSYRGTENDFTHPLLMWKDIIYDTLLDGKKKKIYIVKMKEDSHYRQMDISFVPESELVWYKLYFCYGREYSKKIRNAASQKGFLLNEKGLFDRKTKQKIEGTFHTEKDVLSFLGFGSGVE